MPVPWRRNRALPSATRHMAAADGWGLAADLTAALARARIVSRGPKATGALRAMVSADVDLQRTHERHPLRALRLAVGVGLRGCGRAERL